MKYVVHNDYSELTDQLIDCIKNFETKGEAYGNQKRNSLKLFRFDELVINAKSFKIPNVANQLVYKFFRKSKAQRSFEYAVKLLELNINTPQPIAYFELPTTLLFKSSYYLSEQLECDLTYRELSRDLEFPDHENILRAFTRFTYLLHEKNVLFLDHSPGNTLIKKSEDGYEFYLVDLNRMQFKELDFETRIRNFERLTKHESMVKIMSDEYSKCSGEDYNKIFNLMWSSTQNFQNKFHRKKRLKKKLKFWK